jgi:hypothetical protein
VPGATLPELFAAQGSTKPVAWILSFERHENSSPFADHFFER